MSGIALSSSGSPSYRLASHMHACRTAHHVVLLDVKHDQYLGVNAAVSDALGAWIAGWPKSERPAHSPADPAADDEVTGFLTEMLENGMLASECSASSPGAPVSATPPRKALIEGYVEVKAAIGLGDVVRFLVACITARVLLRWRSFEMVVAHIQNRRRRRAPQSVDASAVRDDEVASARMKVAVYRRLRPFLFTAYNRCLFDSLALSEFLASYELFPHCVFGVATNPFLAHCWLQNGCIVLNDTPENVRRFTPIMIV